MSRFFLGILFGKFSAYHAHFYKNLQPMTMKVHYKEKDFSLPH